MKQRKRVIIELMDKCFFHQQSVWLIPLILKSLSLKWSLTCRARIFAAVAAIDKVIIKFRREGTEVKLIGLNEASQAMIDNFGVHDKPDAEQSLGAH